MKERQEFWLALALISTLFAVLFVVQATRTQARAALSTSTAGDARATFGAQCSACHGKDGRGKTLRGRRAHARDLTEGSWQDEVTDERLFNSINKGRGKKMPAYGKKLSENQIDELVQYVRRLRK
jgi:cytochrome c oxidase cbb3-type subunit 3